MSAAPPDGSGGPHAFVDDLDAPELRNDDHHHLKNALRLAEGDACTVGDGLGRWRPCRFAKRPEPVGEIVIVARSASSLGVGIVPVKGERVERTVAALTELGIDRILLLTSERSVVRWDEARATKNHERLRRVVEESAMQSRQVYLPRLDPLSSLAAFLEATTSQVVMADPRAVHPLNRAAIEHAPAPTVIVGPEGGWSDAERAAVEVHVRLPGQVLRAQTAALAAATMLAATRT